MVLLSSYALDPAEAARKKAATPAFTPSAADTMPDAAPEEINVPQEPPFSVKPLPE